MKKIILAAAILSIGTIVFADRASAEIQEGKWSMTMVTRTNAPGAQEAMKEMENMSAEDKAMMQQFMGGMGMGVNANAGGFTTTAVTCVTNQAPVPNPRQDCQSTHTLQGSTVSFQSVCSDGTSSGQVTYQNNSMSGLINSQQNNGTSATIEMTGQYIGPCD